MPNVFSRWLWHPTSADRVATVEDVRCFVLHTTESLRAQLEG